ncbi:DUF2312 domain-containing protein [Methylobacterium sp. WL7]|uniref:DUF2312 domain-containing protein n=1 Tax=Methylobacterium sp. WL7 TaxID=2603900 RepID=UPI0011CCAFB0|nr:DUF2312 domain-containing protein [Methylobacterium sp. WL7]TXN40520.1 DUF2312 domain-containing protein [Methylobacterium sp. WL7]
MSAEDQIRQYAERIVRLEQERKALAEDIKECKAEAKAAGFSPKLITTCVRIMLMEAEKRAEALSGHEELDLYLSAVGLVASRATDGVEEVSPGADASAQRHARVIPQATDAAQGRATPATARVSDVVRGDILEAPALGRSGATTGERPSTFPRPSAPDLDPSELFGEPRSRIHPLPATGREEGRHLHSDRSS